MFFIFFKFIFSNYLTFTDPLYNNTSEKYSWTLTTGIGSSFKLCKTSVSHDTRVTKTAFKNHIGFTFMVFLILNGKEKPGSL